MFKSLASKIVGMGVLVASALVALAGMLIFSSREMEEGFGWVERTQVVLALTARPVDTVRQVESELRAAIISGDPASYRLGPALLDQALRETDELVRVTAAEPAQNQRARELREMLRKRVALLSEGLALAQRGALARLPREKAIARNRAAIAFMHEVDVKRVEMLAAEQQLVHERGERARSLFRSNRDLVAIGLPAIILLIGVLKSIMVLTLRRTTRVMTIAMETFDTGNTTGRIDTNRVGSSEFAKIARRYNGMADRLQAAMARQQESEDMLQTANQQLQQRSAALEARSEVVERLGLLSHRLSAVRSDAEFAEVIRCYAPQVLPDNPGAIYAHNNSRNHLVRIANW